ncbi:unnamed protein product [Rotaria socialis]
MVVTTRSAAKRHYQSTNSSINTIASEPVAAKRVCGKKKQDEQPTSVSNLIPPPKSHTTTASLTSSVINVSLPTSTVKNKSLLVVSPSNTSFPSSSLSDTLSSITEQDKPSENNDEKELQEETKWSVVVDKIEWCKTSRGNDRLCMGGYTYDLISCSLKNNSSRYRCSKKDIGCRSVVYISLGSNTFKNSNNVEHNHPPNHSDVKRLLVMQKIKERVTTEPTSVIPSKFYKIRSKLLPPNPKSLDFEVPDSCAMTHDGENFLIYDSTREIFGGRLMIFSTKVFIEMLCECEVILIDGTFKTRPIMFAQVYVIMGKHLGEVIPFVWCLTPKKTQPVYEKIFNILKKKADEYGGKFEPQQVYLDFEVAAINALENVVSSDLNKAMDMLIGSFPNVVIHGCWYHFTQSIYRNIQKIGLASMYEKKKDVQTWLRSFMALPLVKHSALDASVKLLMDNPPASNNLLNQFIEYFQNQWIIRVPSKYWNIGPIHLRCNNAVEAYNNRLQHRFGMHPQLWNFIHVLKGEESLVMMRTKQIRSGNYREKMILFSTNTQRAGKKIKNLARLYEIGTIASIKTKKQSCVQDSTSVASNTADTADGGN